MSPNLSEMQYALSRTLLRAREVVMLELRPLLARHDITEQQWRVLYALAEQGPLEATALADEASIRPPSLTRIIKALEVRQYMERSNVKGDGRRTLLAIMPAGLALIEELNPARIAIYDGIRQRFGESQHKQLLNLLEALIQSRQG